MYFDYVGTPIAWVLHSVAKPLVMWCWRLLCMRELFGSNVPETIFGILVDIGLTSELIKSMLRVVREIYRNG